ncbi:MAG: HNH endonuclease, partial [Mycobacteriales bacterium]
MPVDGDIDSRLRAAAFAHLRALARSSPDGALRSADINTFSFGDRRLPLVVQTGIWKPAALGAALSIRTAFTPPSSAPPYLDAIGPDGLVRDADRGTDPLHSDNRALRAAGERSLPLAYFVGVAKGAYVPYFPVWIVAEDQVNHQFCVALDEAQRHTVAFGAAPDDDQRAYLHRLTKLRLHQPIFRAQVLRAYGGACAMCRLRHPELLEAAHILPDGHPRGLPVVPNGLSLCAIHHAAYDHNILGVRPDLVIEVAAPILAEVDGPMLTHGLQELAGASLVLPRATPDQPDRDRLAE